MCNIYQVSAKKGSDKGVRGKVAAAVGKLRSARVRISDPGVVVLADERVEIMRWGFQRSFNPAINNARSDKLESVMWAEAFRERRCVIPASLFYEWGPGAGGRKQAYEFHNPEDDYLWIAGLWEPGEGDLGFCYSMVTTAASPVMRAGQILARSLQIDQGVIVAPSCWIIGDRERAGNLHGDCPAEKSLWPDTTEKKGKPFPQSLPVGKSIRPRRWRSCPQDAPAPFIKRLQFGPESSLPRLVHGIDRPATPCISDRTSEGVAGAAGRPHRHQIIAEIRQHTDDRRSIHPQNRRQFCCRDRPPRPDEGSQVFTGDLCGTSHSAGDYAS